MMENLAYLYALTEADKQSGKSSNAHRHEKQFQGKKHLSTQRLTSVHDAQMLDVDTVAIECDVMTCDRAYPTYPTFYL